MKITNCIRNGLYYLAVMVYFIILEYLILKALKRPLTFRVIDYVYYFPCACLLVIWEKHVLFQLSNIPERYKFSRALNFVYWIKIFHCILQRNNAKSLFREYEYLCRIKLTLKFVQFCTFQGEE